MASRATACACSSPTRPPAPSRTPDSTTCRRLLSPGDLVVVNTSATLAAALPAIRARRAEARAPALDTGRGQGSRAVLDRGAALRRCAVRLGRGRRALRAPRRCVGPRSSRPTPASGSGSRASSCPGRCRLVPRRARQPDPLRLRPAPLAALGLPERLRGRARQRRDAERRPAVHDGADHAARRRRRSRRADRAAHRRLLAGAPRAPVPGALPRARGDGPPRQRRPLPGAAASSRREPPSSARSRRSPGPTASSRPARAGRT